MGNKIKYLSLGRVNYRVLRLSLRPESNLTRVGFGLTHKHLTECEACLRKHISLFYLTVTEKGKKVLAFTPRVNVKNFFCYQHLRQIS